MCHDDFGRTDGLQIHKILRSTGFPSHPVSSLQMGIVGHRLQAQFVSSTGDNFYEEGLTDVEAGEFKDSFTDIYTHSSLQVPWYAGKMRCLATILHVTCDSGYLQPILSISLESSFPPSGTACPPFWGLPNLPASPAASILQAAC